MVNAKRFYVYGVTAVALGLLLWGSTSILGLALRAAGVAAGPSGAVDAEVARDELSLAVALVLVALPVFAVHLWLIRRMLGESPQAAAEERASKVRSVYFFLVLTITGAIAVVQLYEVVQQLAGAALADEPTYDLPGATAAVLVTGVAWSAHVIWRRSDLLTEPARTADDWLTRVYLYGGLFLTALALAYWLSQMLTVAGSEIVGARRSWEPWQDEIVSPIAGAVGCAVGWSANWILGLWLVRAGRPLGEAHRGSRTRVGYFMAVLLVASGAVLLLVSASLATILAEVMGVWRPTEGSRLLEDIAGPLLMALPFAVLAWWHWRRALGEALAFGGPDRFEPAHRSTLYAFAFVGLAGTALGAFVATQGLIDALGASVAAARTEALRDLAALGLGATLAGLVLWIPTWRMVRRDRAADPVAVADSVPRRAYLMLVSGLAVVAVMASLAYLAYQSIRQVLDAGPVDEAAWAVSGAVVGGVVLAYHLLLLRTDGSILAARSPAVSMADPEEARMAMTVEIIEISAPAGTDLESINTAVRDGLPDGAEMRVVQAPRPSSDVARLHP